MIDDADDDADDDGDDDNDDDDGDDDDDDEWCLGPSWSSLGQSWSPLETPLGRLGSQTPWIPPFFENVSSESPILSRRRLETARPTSNFFEDVSNGSPIFKNSTNSQDP